MANAYPSGDLERVDLADVLRILGDPVRLSIVRKLADGELHAKSIEEWGLGLQKSALSHHFKSLRILGLTEVVVSGRTHGMRLRRAEIERRFPGLLGVILDSPPAAEAATP